ncbi:helix-turn-helix domain-containing protein [Massiliimalia timonensis]|uniref:helix-turn-helix domain-containing protein n=1 Tax=Massiliimalia timonensis TaxID=1987501 RepID=UPI00189FE31E|nr:helix-turn-helix transcriptional regulator [Massiliimalia timonensis]
MTFGERIKGLREDRDLKQNEVAKILNILPKSLSNYELDVYEPPIDVIIKLANFYGVNIDYLLGNTKIKICWDKFDRTLEINGSHVSCSDIYNKLSVLTDDELKNFIGLLFNLYSLHENKNRE